MERIFIHKTNLENQYIYKEGQNLDTVGYI
jgi:hypothetical protein